MSAFNCYREGTILQKINELMRDNPRLTMLMAKKQAMQTTRIRSSNYVMAFCSGVAEKARRKLQIEKGFIRATA